MKVYVASSWRNNFQPAVLEKLREAGHDAYDYKNPESSFHWSQIDEGWKNWRAVDFRMHLEHPLAVKGFNTDMAALRACDAVVIVLPCGKSAHLEAGWAAGAGKKTILYMTSNSPGIVEPELMYNMFDHRCTSMGEVLAALNDR